MISFLAAFTIITADLTIDFGVKVNLLTDESKTESLSAIVKIVLGLFVFTPCSLIEKLHHLRYATMVMFCLVLFMMAIIVLETPVYMNEEGYDFSVIKYYSTDIRSILLTTAIGIYSFASTFQQVQIAREL